MDAIDTNILQQLSVDAKLSDVQLAKALQTPKHVIHHRRKKLTEKGVIHGSQLIVNYAALGFTEYVLYFRFASYLNHKERIAEFLKNSSCVRWACESFPKFNLRVVILAREMEDVERFISDLETHCNEQIVEREILITRYLLKTQSYFPGSALKYEKKNETSFDDGDLSFLKLLDENPTATLLELSNKSSYSVEGVRKKLKKLTESDLVHAIQSKIDISSLGVAFWGIFLLQIDRFDRYEKALQSLITNTVGYGKTRKLFGNWNIELTFYIRDFKDLMLIVHELESLVGADLNFYQLQIYTSRFFKHNVNVPNIMLEKK